MFKKLFYLITLVALLAAASLPGGAAFAAPRADGDEVKGFAKITNIDLVSTKPVAFKLTGSITCDRPAIATTVTGKTIVIVVFDIKAGSSTACGAPKSGSGTVTLPKQPAPGTYTVLVNPNPSTGSAQKKFTVVVP